MEYIDESSFQRLERECINLKIEVRELKQERDKLKTSINNMVVESKNIIELLR